jgi:uncharacterized membrane-anchored protein YhcB (DUF1043 family)
MTDDLLKRLDNDSQFVQEHVAETMAEAKSRIETLEAALQWYAEHCQKGGDDIEGPSGDYGQRAICALKGEEFRDD